MIEKPTLLQVSLKAIFYSCLGAIAIAALIKLFENKIKKVKK